jgi:hypothetical protein
MKPMSTSSVKYKKGHKYRRLSIESAIFMPGEGLRLRIEVFEASNVEFYLCHSAHSVTKMCQS